MAGRNNIVNGLIKTKDWFFQVTGTPMQRGVRFLTGDRPNESVFRSFFESFANKAEVTDRAYEDISGVNLSEKQGLTTLSTDSQAKSRIAKSDSISRAVQPSQLPEVTGISPIIVTIDEDTTTHNKYEVSIDPEALNTCRCVINSGLIIEEQLPSDADIVVFYDGSSFLGSSLTTAIERVRNWYTTKVNTTSFTGKLIEITIGDGGSEYNSNYGDPGYTNASYAILNERFILWSSAYLDNYFTNGTITESTDPNTHTLTTLSTPTNTKCLFISFIDETYNAYHSGATNSSSESYQKSLESLANESPTASYITDYNVFTNNHSRFEFYKNIIYPARATTSNSVATNALFHAFLEKAITYGTWDINKGGTRLQINEFNTSATGAAGVEWTINCMDFMLTSNPFSASNVDGLERYGFINSAYSFPANNTSMLGITQPMFDIQMDEALNSDNGIRTITLIPYLDFDDGSREYNYEGAVSFTTS